MQASQLATTVDLLKVSPPVKRALADFVSQVVTLYGDHLLSVAAFGSAVTGDYEERRSDVNVLVVHTELDLGELKPVAELSRRWLKKLKLAPRFLSKRNLDQAVHLFQVDFLSMRDAHVILFGEDLLSGIQMDRDRLHWQLAYEVKAMRMRVKQQYWRVESDARLMRNVIVDRFTSLAHLMRALLLLRGLPAPLTRREIVDAGVTHFGLDRDEVNPLVELKESGSLPSRDKLLVMFDALMNVIRAVDSSIDEVAS